MKFGQRVRLSHAYLGHEKDPQARAPHGAKGAAERIR